MNESNGYYFLLAFPADIGVESRLRRPLVAGNAYTRKRLHQETLTPGL